MPEHKSSCYVDTITPAWTLFCPRKTERLAKRLHAISFSMNLLIYLTSGYLLTHYPYGIYRSLRFLFLSLYWFNNSKYMVSATHTITFLHWYSQHVRITNQNSRIHKYLVNYGSISNPFYAVRSYHYFMTSLIFFFFLNIVEFFMKFWTILLRSSRTSLVLFSAHTCYGETTAYHYLNIFFCD